MQKLPALLSLLTLLGLTQPTLATATDDNEPDAASEGKCDTYSSDDASKDEDSKKEIPEAKVWVTRHKIKMNGATLAYTATAGTMHIKDDKDEPIALFGFTAYVKDGVEPGSRPIMFAYNGGPGSASGWLHMGILGLNAPCLRTSPRTRLGHFARSTTTSAFSTAPTS